MANCPTYSLQEIVDNYLIRKFNDKRKYAKEYLIISKGVWKRLFWNTLYVTKSEWLTVQRGKPYNFIYCPPDMHIFVKASVEDKKLIRDRYNVNKVHRCNTLVPLAYNSSINVIPQPTHQSCGCGKSCSALCGDINSWTVTTKPVVIGTTTYTEKTWLKYCNNGDIIRYREIPTPKYTAVVTAGDYNNDENNDYSIGSAYAPYTVVTQTEQEIICKLKTKECGCPEDTPENIQLFNEFCGCHAPYWNHNEHNECYEFQENINNNHYGEIKFSENGDKIYLKGLRKGTKFVLLTWQTDGFNIDGSVRVPDYCDRIMYTGIEEEARLVNDKFNYDQKMGSWYLHVREINEVIKGLNRLSMTFLQNLQDAKIRY